MIEFTGVIDNKAYNKEIVPLEVIAEAFGVKDFLDKPTNEFVITDMFTKKDRLNGGETHGVGFSVPSRYIGTHPKLGSIDIRYYRTKVPKVAGSATIDQYKPRSLMFVGKKMVKDQGDREQVFMFLTTPLNASSPISKKGGRSRFYTYDRDKKNLEMINFNKSFVAQISDIIEKSTTDPLGLIAKARGLTFKGKSIQSQDISSVVATLISWIREDYAEFKKEWSDPYSKIRATVLGLVHNQIAVYSNKGGQGTYSIGYGNESGSKIVDIPEGTNPEKFLTTYLSNNKTIRRMLEQLEEEKITREGLNKEDSAPKELPLEELSAIELIDVSYRKEAIYFDKVKKSIHLLDEKGELIKDSPVLFSWKNDSRTEYAKYLESKKELKTNLIDHIKSFGGKNES